MQNNFTALNRHMFRINLSVLHSRISLTVLTLLLSIVASGSLSAETVREKIGDLYYDLDPDTYEASVTYEYNNSTNNYVSLRIVKIPESVESEGQSYRVTSIGNRAFYRNKSITSIDLPNSISTIGVTAFYNCQSLTSITIPNSVISIGQGAFLECIALTSIEISESITSIGLQVFSGCSGLTNVVIPESVTSIEQSAFSGCSSLQSIELPESVTKISHYAFKGCKSLTSINITEEVTFIGTAAFQECSSLTSINIPNKLDYIMKETFSGCTNLTEVTFVDGTTNIRFDANVFSGVELNSLYLGREYFYYDLAPEQLPFYNQVSLTDLTIGSSVKSLSSDAFQGCTGLNTVTLADGKNPLSLDASVFKGAELETLYLGRDFLGDSPFSNNTSLANLTIGGSVTTIGNEAFQGCTALTEVTLVDGEETLNFGENVFKDCPIETLNLNRNFNGSWKVQPFSYKKTLTDLSIGDAVTSIADYAFVGCSELREVTLPESVTCIGAHAFDYCPITNIKIPKAVTTIETHAFYSCSKLESLNIPNSVTSIAYNAFSGCTNLKTVKIEDGEKPLEFDRFVFDKSVYGGVPIETLYLGRDFTCTSIDFDAQPFSYKESLTNVQFGQSINSIPNYAFYNCSALSTIEIPGFVTSIGDGAFQDCTALTDVTLADGTEPLVCGRSVFEGVDIETLYLGRDLTCTGDSPFVDKTSLKNLTISDAVTSIGYSAFMNCIGVTNIVIPNSVTTIGAYAFAACKMSSIAIPKSVTSIDTGSFYCCELLTSIDIPNTVTSIGNLAFAGCTALTEVTLVDGTEPLNFGTNVFNDVELETLNIGRDIEYQEGNYPFANETSLKNLTFSNLVTSFDWTPFQDCKNLESIGLPNCLTEIEDNMFKDFRKLSSIKIPDSITKIGNSAFYGLSALKSITLPESLESIGDWAFCGCPLTEVVIPKSVKNIGDNVFYNCRYITSINILGPITTIGEDTFNCCEALETINIPESVTLIGNGAFESCRSLTSIAIPGSVTSIGYGAFRECKALTDVTLADGKETLVFGNSVFAGVNIENLYLGRNFDCTGSFGSQPFYQKESLKKLRIGDYVTAIKDRAFWACNSLTSVEIPASVESLGESAFVSCRKLTSVKISGTSLKEIQDDAFADCGSLEEVIIPESVTSIGNRAFKGCSRLKSLKFPESVEVFGTDVFKGCTALESLSLPNCNSFTEIGSDMFAGFSNLKSIKIPGSVTTIGNGAFQDCIALTDVTLADGKETLAFGNSVFAGVNIENLYLGRNFNCSGLLENQPFCQKESLKNLRIGDSVTAIGWLAFFACKNLTLVEIPSSVKSIGTSAFNSCGNLSSVKILGTSLTEIQGAAFAGCGNLNEVNIPTSVTSIGNQAFSNCSSLKEISIPESVSKIEEGTFQRCSSLTALNIPSSVTSIEDRAFSGCTALTDVTLADGTESLDFGADVFKDVPIETLYLGRNFSCNPSTQDGEILEGEALMKAQPFYNKTELSELTIGSKVTAINDYAFQGCVTLSSVAIPGSVTTIGESAFQECKGLETVEIPASVTAIGNKAFYLCQNLTAINIKGNVKEIGAYVFFGCYALKSVMMPESVESIGSQAFFGCGKLESIEIPIAVTTIEEYAFSGCHTLKSLDIPNSVETIGEYAFNDCSSLVSVTLPSTLASIEATAFSACEKIKDIYYFANEPIEAARLWEDKVYKDAKLHVFPKAYKYIVTNDIKPWVDFADNISPVSYADFDLDGKVYIADAVKIANRAVDNEIEGAFIEELADVNEDDYITISDAVGAVKIALAQPSEEGIPARIPAANDLDITDCLVLKEPVALGDNCTDLDIELDNSIGYVALQTDVYVPEGMKLQSVSNGPRALNHSVMHNKVGENVYRIAVFNFNGVDFDVCQGSLLTLHFTTDGSNGSDITLRRSLASDAKGNAYRLGVCYSGTNGVGNLIGNMSSAEGAPICVEGGEIKISGAEGECIAVYTTDGRIVAKGTVENGTAAITVGKGVYIVIVGEISAKVVVR